MCGSLPQSSDSRTRVCASVSSLPPGLSHSVGASQLAQEDLAFARPVDRCPARGCPRGAGHAAGAGHTSPRSSICRARGRVNRHHHPAPPVENCPPAKPVAGPQRVDRRALRVACVRSPDSCSRPPASPPRQPLACLPAEPVSRTLGGVSGSRAQVRAVTRRPSFRRAPPGSLRTALPPPPVVEQDCVVRVYSVFILSSLTGV